MYCCIQLLCGDVYQCDLQILEFGTLICSKMKARQAEISQAKSSAWEALGSVLGHMVGKCESVCCGIEARMDSSAAMLTRFSRSSMYKFSIAEQENNKISM